MKNKVMKAETSGKGEDNVVYYVSAEARTTPAQGMRTLYVYGNRDPELTVKLAKEHKCHHISLNNANSWANTKTCGENIAVLLSTGLKVSLEFSVSQHHTMVSNIGSDVFGHQNFIPLVRCDVVELVSSSPNLMLLINNKNKDGVTNVGSWCLPYYQVADSNRYVGVNEQPEVEVVMRKSDLPKKSKSDEE